MVLKFLLPLAAAASLSACVESDPQAQAQKTQMRTQASASASEIAKAELTPLIPVCLSALASGAPAPAHDLTALGFSKSLGGYTKKRGTSTLDRINLTNTTFVSQKTTCTMSLGNFAAVNEAGAVVRNALKARGYTQGASDRKRGTAFTKAGQTLYLNGYLYSSFTSLSLTKG